MGFVTDTLGITSRDAQRSDYQANEANLNNFDFSKGLGDAFGFALNSADYGHNANDRAVTDAYMNQINGTAPSVAQMQLQNATDKNLAGAASRAASSRGINPAMAARLSMDAQQQTNSDAAGQAAVLRAQEQQAAQAGFANVLAQRQQGANQLFGSISGAQNQQNQANINNAMGAQGINADISKANLNSAVQNQENRGKVIGGLASGIASGGISTALNSASSLLKKAPGGGGVPASGTIPMAGGGMIPGDHPQNDTVHAILSPGEIVLPRSVTMSPDAAEKAMAFVEAIKKQKGKK